MSISAYVGLPRSGKSFSVVRVMIDAIKEGRTVYTNIPLHTEVWLAELGACPVVFDSQEIIDDENWFDKTLPAGCLLVLDECWRFWPAGLKANNASDVHKEFLAMHGHKVDEHGVTTQVILVTQDLAQLAAFVRLLVDKTFRSTKLDAVGQENRFRVDIYQGAVTGQNPPQSNRLREMFYKYEPDIYKFYKSSSMSQAGDVGNESRVDSRANILKGGKIKSIVAAIIILPFVAGGLIWTTYYRLHKQIDKRPGSVAAAPVDAAAIERMGKIKADRASGFLHGRSIVISTIADYGAGKVYRFRVKEGDGVSRFGQRDLNELGYTVIPVGDCAVKIVGHSETIYAMCVEEQEAGIVAQAFMPPSESTSL